MNPIPIDRSVVDRFWEKVNTTSHNECWEWVAYKTIRGYGRISVGNKVIAAHRLSWKIHFDAIPEDMCVLHHCDNPSCVNPSHLFLGSHADNMHDMRDKGRAVGHVGEDHPRTKLRESEVIEIRKIYDTNDNKCGLTKRLSDNYNIPLGTMSKIVRHHTWNI